MRTVLVTGSSGLIGTALRAELAKRGFDTRGFDIRGVGADLGDITQPEALVAAAEGAVGIVHLAAVSRVIWGEKDPEKCWAVNAVGSRNVFEAARRSSSQPWVIFSSSREVYGQPTTLPCHEDAPVTPVNIYGRSKADAEETTYKYRDFGLNTSVIRLSNVYGSIDDHHDRVVPAFSRGAALGQPLRVDGSDHTFDFTHLDDTIDGIARLIVKLDAGELKNPPPIHFLTGEATTLGQLAHIAAEAGGGRSSITEAPPRSFDVSHFWGDPSRSNELLGYKAVIDIRTGVHRLVADFAAAHAAGTL